MIVAQRRGDNRGTGLVDIGENEQPLTSLAGVDRGLTTLWVDGTAKDFAALREFEALANLRIYRLPRRHVPVLADRRWPALTTLSVRHADAGDLQFLGKLATLETLTVWQCPKLTRLDGVERLTRLTSLYFNDLGTIESLTPLAALTGLRILALTGGIEKTQALPSLAPLRAGQARAAAPDVGQGGGRRSRPAHRPQAAEQARAQPTQFRAG